MRERELYIANLDVSATAADLELAFARWGGRKARVLPAATGIPSTTGYVTVNADDMADAITAMDGMRLHNRPIFVYECARSAA